MVDKKKDLLKKFVETGSDFEQASKKRVVKNEKGSSKPVNKDASKPGSRDKSRTVKQGAGKTASKQAGKISQEGQKTTFYLKKDLGKGLRILSVETDKNLSLLVNKAIGDLLEKYAK